MITSDDMLQLSIVVSKSKLYDAFAKMGFGIDALDEASEYLGDTEHESLVLEDSDDVKGIAELLTFVAMPEQEPEGTEEQVIKYDNGMEMKIARHTSQSAMTALKQKVLDSVNEVFGDE